MLQTCTSIRFKDATSRKDFQCHITNNILLRVVRIDSKLSRSSIIVIEEDHISFMTTNISVGLLKETCAREKDLQLVTMSAKFGKRSPAERQSETKSNR